MKKSFTILAALVVVCLSLPAAAVPTYMPEMVDAVVDSAGGTVTSQLSVQGYHGGIGSYGSIQRSYLMFDLSSIPDNATVIGAWFGMVLDGINQGTYYSCDPSTGLYYVEDDTWTEDDIDWDNAPGASYGGDYQDTVDNQIYEWDILNGTDFQWDWMGDLVDDRISLMIDSQFEGVNNWAHFSNPYLSIDYTTPCVPEPATITLCLIGLGSAGVAFRKKKI